MHAHLTGTSFRGNAILPLVAGVACFAFVCGGFWVLKSRTRRYLVRDIDCDTDTKEEREDRISQLPDVFTYDQKEKKREDRINQLPDVFTYDKKEKKREDRISQLPDDVISLIISRLKTRDAVRTSVLSRRWRHVYTFINEVRFYCSDVHHSTCYHNLNKKFVEGVDTFLQHHSASKIMSFKLVCCFRGCILDSFRKWIHSVGSFGVERLTVGYCSINLLRESDPPVFSTDFLPEASSVTHLCLRGGSFETPNQNVLKVLQLENIAFTSENVECILTNCPSLQSLNLIFCVLPLKLQIHGPALQLKSLMISYCEMVEEIDLSAINLINFEICYRSALKLSFSHVPLLQSVVIDYFSSGVLPYVFGKVAKDLPHLERMVLVTYASFFEGWKMDGALNKFSNLRTLVLLLEYYNKFNLLELVTLLNAFPLLHKFQVSMMLESTFNKKQAEERVVRRDTQLKEVEFNGFSGTEHDYKFILYILKNVVSLERLSITVHSISYLVLDRCWTTSVGNPGDDEENHRIIGQRLQGLANSKNVEIIIR